MGTFVFKWEHPASEVFVTGTFDDWQKTEKLIKTGNGFEKEVTLPCAADKIYYKFVVDGNWVTDHTAPQENDHSGNLNNVLTTDRIAPHTPATAGIMSGVTPSSTTAQLAKNVPKENGAINDLPGAFPVTPANEPETFSVNPIPASEGPGNPFKLAPGEGVPDPANTISSAVHDDEELKAADAANGQTFGVNPIPATAGAGNPIKLAAGEPVPPASQITGNTVASTVRTDKESYENSGGMGNAPVLPPVVTPQVERDANGTGILDMPSNSRNLIPESSLPMGEDGAGSFDAGPTIQSVGPTSTTAGLAAGVPLEKDSKKKNKKKNKNKKSSAPEIVQESQEKADFPPEASASAEEVKEKADVEKELLAEVPKAPVTSDDNVAETKEPSMFTGNEAVAAIGGAAVAIGGAAAVGAVAAKDKVTESFSGAPAAAKDKFTESISGTPAEAKDKFTESFNGAPAAAKDKFTESFGGAQATAKDKFTESFSGAAASKDKFAESVSSAPAGAKDKFTESVSSAPGAAEIRQSVPASVQKSISAMNETAKRQSVAGGGEVPSEVSSDAPAVVRESISKAQASPEAAAYVEPIEEKQEVETQLLEEVPTDLSKGEPAPKAAVAPSPEQAELPQEAQLVPPKIAETRFDSRDVSPTTVPGDHAQAAAAPLVTTGVERVAAPKKSVSTSVPEGAAAAGGKSSEAGRSSGAAEPEGAGAAAENGTAAKAKKRRSFFGKLKDKLRDL